jgi:hypothetical protein
VCWIDRLNNAQLVVSCLGVLTINGTSHSFRGHCLASRCCHNFRGVAQW